MRTTAPLPGKRRRGCFCTIMKNWFIKHREVLAYLVFGVLTTLLNIVLYALFSRLFGYTAANSWGNVLDNGICILFAYLTNRAFVFASRPTIRKAVQILVDEGYLEKRKKRGTIVCDPTIRQEFAQVIQTFDKEVKEKGLTPSTKVLTFKQEKAEEEVRQKLNLKETEKVYKLVRLRYVDDQPNVLVTTYVPCRLFEHLSEVDFEKESLYQTFHKEGRDITSIQRKLDVILADETCADLLDVKNGDPLFYFHSTGYDESHTAIEYSIAKYRGDRNSFVFQLSNNVYYS